MPDGRAKIVIVGAGFGGIEAAKSLRRAPVELTVIDRQNHHCFQPLLYQVATAALSPADVAWPIRHILRKQKNATVLMAEVRAVDTSKRLVHCCIHLAVGLRHLPARRTTDHRGAAGGAEVTSRLLYGR
jgi:NADH dehydrogenase